MWFEGSMGYHLYTLNWIFKFEYLARNTIYSLLSQPEYRDKIHRALSLSFYLAKEDGTFPKINESLYQIEINAHFDTEIPYTYVTYTKIK